MTYTKPEIFLLGSAVSIIQGGKDDLSAVDPDRHPIVAYELDE